MSDERMIEEERQPEPAQVGRRSDAVADGEQTEPAPQLPVDLGTDDEDFEAPGELDVEGHWQRA